MRVSGCQCVSTRDRVCRCRAGGYREGGHLACRKRSLSILAYFDCGVCVSMRVGVSEKGHIDHSGTRPDGSYGWLSDLFDKWSSDLLI